MALGPWLILSVLVAVAANSWLPNAVLAQSNEPYNQWQAHCKSASKAYAVEDYDEAEKQLRCGFVLAKQARLTQEKLIRIQTNLAECLLRQGKLAEANAVLRDCVVGIRNGNLEDTPLHLRVVHLKNEVINDKDEAIANSKKQAELVACIYGTNVKEYSKALCQLMELEISWREYSLAEQTGMRVLALLQEQHRADSGMRLAVTANLGMAIFSQFLAGTQSLDRGSVLLEQTIRWSKTQTIANKADLYRCYRYKVLIEYHRPTGQKQMEQAAMFLIRAVPQDRGWPNPELQAIVGTAYHALADKCLNTCPRLSASYAEQAVKNLSAAPADDPWAAGHVHWARCTWAEGLMKLGRIDEADRVMKLLHPGNQHGTGLSIRIGDVLCRLSKELTAKHKYDRAKHLYKSVIAYCQSAKSQPDCKQARDHLLEQAKKGLADCTRRK